MKSAFPEKFEGVDLGPFEDMAAEEAIPIAKKPAEPSILKGDGVTWVMKRHWGRDDWDEIARSYPANEKRKAA
jgi:hypothetical protein